MKILDSQKVYFSFTSGESMRVFVGAYGTDRFLNCRQIWTPRTRVDPTLRLILIPPEKLFGIYLPPLPAPAVFLGQLVCFAVG